MRKNKLIQGKTTIEVLPAHLHAMQPIEQNVVLEKGQKQLLATQTANRSITGGKK
jgi:hypothetical protein